MDSEWVIGVDECGLGSIAGPLVVCGALVRRDWTRVLLDEEGNPTRKGLNDSKKLTPKRRQAIQALLQEDAAGPDPTAYFYVASCEPARFDQLRWELAIDTCYREVLWHLLDRQPDAEVHLDGAVEGPLTHVHAWLNTHGHRWRTEPEADGKWPCVMAASVWGKVYHDARMAELHELHPAYEWSKNQGYPTKAHKAAIAAHGVTPHHRRTYGPVHQFLARQG